MGISFFDAKSWLQAGLLLFTLSANVCSSGAARGNERSDEDSIRYSSPARTSREGTTEILNAVLFHIANDYVIPTEERQILREGMLYYAKNYAQDLTVRIKDTGLEVTCGKLVSKSIQTQAPIEELYSLEKTLEACMTAKARKKFEFYHYALASAVLSALPIPGEFFTKARTDELMTEMRGHHGGIGLEITKKGDDCSIVRVFQDSPAERAGLLKGMLLEKINGESLSGLELADIIKKLRGKPGSILQVEIRDPAAKSVSQISKTYELTREIVTISHIDFKVLEGKILHMHVHNLTNNARESLMKELGKKQEIDGVILDLRGSPGGLMDGIKYIADPFLKEGVMFEVRGRKAVRNKTVTADPEVFFEGKPMVVITDDETVAGSEMVAIALQQSGRAKVYGRPTRGKGEVSNVISMMYGTSMSLPILEMYRRDGRLMRMSPVKPDVELKLGEDALKAAVSDLRKK